MNRMIIEHMLPSKSRPTSGVAQAMWPRRPWRPSRRAAPGSSRRASAVPGSASARGTTSSCPAGRRRGRIKTIVGFFGRSSSAARRDCPSCVRVASPVTRTKPVGNSRETRQWFGAGGRSECRTTCAYGGSSCRWTWSCRISTRSSSTSATARSRRTSRPSPTPTRTRSGWPSPPSTATATRRRQRSRLHDPVGLEAVRVRPRARGTRRRARARAGGGRADGQRVQLHHRRRGERPAVQPDGQRRRHRHDEPRRRRCAARTRPHASSARLTGSRANARASTNRVRSRAPHRRSQPRDRVPHAHVRDAEARTSTAPSRPTSGSARCSSTSRDLAMMGATLANDGVQPASPATGADRASTCRASSA